VGPGLSDLTDREREVAVLVAAGLSNTEIGGRLFISPATVKTHVNRATMKTGARNRKQPVVFADDLAAFLIGPHSGQIQI